MFTEAFSLIVWSWKQSRRPLSKWLKRTMVHLCHEGWTPKNWCFWTVVLEKTLESPLNSKEFKPVHPKGNESWIFIGKTDVEAETPILWPLDVKRWLIWKDPDAGKDWGQEEKGTTEDEMVGWLNGHWAWVSSRSWWWTGRPIVLQSMRSQRVGQDWATELNQKEQTTNKYNNQDEPLENYDRKKPVPKVIHCMFPFYFFPGWAACWMQDLNSLTRDQTCAALKWKHGVLTTGLPENSLYSILEMRKLQDWRTDKSSPWI